MESTGISKITNFLPFEVHSALEELVFDLFPLAWRLLKEHGEFLPYAAAKDFTDKTIYFMPRQESHPQSYQEQIDDLRLRLIKLTTCESVESVAVVFHGKTITKDGSESDAITFALEHISGEASRLYMPYYTSFLKGLIMGSPIAKHSTPSIFTKT